MGAASTENNPLVGLQFSTYTSETKDVLAAAGPGVIFPPFGKVEPEHVAPGIQSMLDTANKQVDELEEQVNAKVADGSLTYDFISLKSEAIDDVLDRSWGTVTHLKSVMDSEGLRKAIEETQPKVVEFG